MYLYITTFDKMFTFDKNVAWRKKKKKNYLSREQGKMADILTDCRMTISRRIEQFPPPSFLFHHFNDDHSIDEDDFTRCRNRTNENTRNSPKINFCSGGIFFFFFFYSS